MWTEEKNVLVQAWMNAEAHARRKHKSAWSRLPISQQVDDVAYELSQLGYGIATQSTISAGRISKRELARARQGLPEGAPDPDSVTGVG